MCKVSMDAFRAGQAPRFGKRVPPLVREKVCEHLPVLEARVGQRIRGAGIQCGFSFELFRGEDHARSYAVAWRQEPGNFIVVRCKQGAREIDDGANWTVEIKATDAERRGDHPLVYRALYSHLKDKGRALRPDEVGLVRNVVRALDRLGLDLEPDRGDPRRRPHLMMSNQPVERCFEKVVKIVVARVMVAGLVGSNRWAAEARALLGWSVEEFDAFATAHGWQGRTARLEAALESDLCRRFTRWAKNSRPDVDVVAQDRDGLLSNLVDGQRPDLTLSEGRGDGVGIAVIEAKLGLTRDSVRTGLSQAREYAFHLHDSGRRWPVLLLLGEDPGYHGQRFSEYVHDTAERLQIGVVVESGATVFRRWHPLSLRGLDVGAEGLIASMSGA